MIRKLLLAGALIGITAGPAGAASFTIDSSNCSGDCYGLSWTLTINDGSYSYGGNTYDYQAILEVADDPAVSGVQNQTISAVNFKVSNSVDSAVLYQAPTTLGNWTTTLNSLNSSGCTGGGAGFVCSSNAINPALFTGSTLTWAWYFDTSDPIFANLIGGHIGAKLTTLSTPGRLLSEEYTAVPEPRSFAILGLGALMFLALRRRFLGVS